MVSRCGYTHTAFLRPERKFDSLEALTRQIDQDKADSMAIL